MPAPPAVNPTPTAPAPPPPFGSSRRAFLFGGALLLGAGLFAAYHETWHGPFVLDDREAIVENPTIRRPATAFFPPTNSGSTVSGRPLLNFSFALNHAFGGTAVAGYRVVNLLIHFGAALTLAGVVRRTLQRPALAARFGAQAASLAWLIAALWALHPLAAGAVTYVAQRAESLAGFFVLLALYAFIRNADTPARRWPVLTVTACLLGVATKEVAATAPLLLLLYDRSFGSGSWRASWQRNHRLLLACAASWVLLGALVIASGGRGGTVGFGAGTWLETTVAQGAGIALYLWRAFVPVGLVFDHGPLVETRWPMVLAGLLITGALLTLTIVLLRRRPGAGFLGAWFFVILAPTSSVIPVVSQPLAEHRMYLPLAAVIGAVVLGLHRLGANVVAVAAAPLLVAAGMLTFDRNRDFQSAVVLWEDTVRKAPDNARAWNNLGIVHRDARNLAEAIRCFTRAATLVPFDPTPHSNLGATLVQQALFAPASAETDPTAIDRGLALLHRAIELEPTNARWHSAYGLALLDAGRIEMALPPLQHALSLAPAEPVHHFHYANALAELDRHADAARHYVTALRLRPDNAEMLANYGALLRAMNRLPESLAQLETATRLQPDSASVRSNLGATLLALGRTDEGVRELETALQLQPDLPQALYHLGDALAAAGRNEEALRHLQHLVALTGPTADLLAALGLLHARVGQTDAAIAHLRHALELNPAHAEARAMLERLLAASPVAPGP